MEPFTECITFGVLEARVHVEYSPHDVVRTDKIEPELVGYLRYRGKDPNTRRLTLNLQC